MRVKVVHKENESRRYANTKVFDADTGEEFRGIVAVKFVAGVHDSLLTLTFADFELDVEAEAEIENEPEGIKMPNNDSCTISLEGIEYTRGAGPNVSKISYDFPHEPNPDSVILNEKIYPPRERDTPYAMESWDPKTMTPSETCRYHITDIDEFASTSGRKKFEVYCRVCGKIIHLGTTAPDIRMEEHTKEFHLND